MFESLDAGTIASYALGAIAIILFGRENFSQKEFASHSEYSFIEHVIPSQLTRERQFYVARRWYVIGLLFAFVLFSMIGDLAYANMVLGGSLNGDAKLSPTAPAIVALAIVGLTPRSEILSKAEILWRRQMYSWASIPQALRESIMNVHASEVNFESLPDFIAEEFGQYVQTESSRFKALYKQAKIFALIEACGQILLDGARMSKVNLDVLSDRLTKDKIKLLAGDLKSLAELVNVSKFLPSAETSDAFEAEASKLNELYSTQTEKLDDMLDKIEMLIACAIASRPEGVTQNEALAALYLKPGEFEFVDNVSSRQTSWVLGSYLIAVIVSAFTLAIVFLIVSRPNDATEAQLFSYMVIWPSADYRSTNLLNSLLIHYPAFGAGLLSFVFYRSWNIKNGRLLLRGAFISRYLFVFIASFLITLVTVQLVRMILPLLSGAQLVWAFPDVSQSVDSCQRGNLYGLMCSITSSIRLYILFALIPPIFSLVLCSALDKPIEKKIETIFSGSLKEHIGWGIIIALFLLFFIVSTLYSTNHLADFIVTFIVQWIGFLAFLLAFYGAIVSQVMTYRKYKVNEM